jgi:hypothetical protein
MGVIRTILALAIALSVALLPAAKVGALTVKPNDMATLAGSMSMSDDVAMADDMPDCCPRTNPCDKGMGDCASMTGCFLKCFGFSGAPVAIVLFALRAGRVMPPLATEAVRSQTGSPPFRPPRV